MDEISFNQSYPMTARKTQLTFKQSHHNMQRKTS